MFQPVYHGPDHLAQDFCARGVIDDSIDGSIVVSTCACVCYTVINSYSCNKVTDRRLFMQEQNAERGPSPGHPLRLGTLAQARKTVPQLADAQALFIRDVRQRLLRTKPF